MYSTNIGDKIGNLTIIKEVDRYVLPSGQTNRAFLCKCDCGIEKTVRKVHLSRGKTISCGCSVSTRNKRGNSKLCKVWRAMKYRCSETYMDKHLYFDKGITVCQQWVDDYFCFENWALSNGYKENLQIDRRNNSKGYSPENCRWVSSKVNCNNRDITTMVFYKNEHVSLKIILHKLNIESNYYAIVGRLKRCWEHNKAIDTPIRKGNYNKSKRV